MLPTVGVWAKATKADTPKAVVEATNEGLRSETEGEVGYTENALQLLNNYSTRARLILSDSQ